MIKYSQNCYTHQSNRAKTERLKYRSKRNPLTYYDGFGMSTYSDHISYLVLPDKIVSLFLTDAV
jgi:hypothetical protein